MIGLILQARLGSTRLPNKMILPFYGNKGILELLVERIKQRFPELPLILATTKNQRDDELVNRMAKTGITIFRGNERDVLNRFIDSAEKHGILKVIRICADNPFLDMGALEYLVNSFREMNFDYWCYCKSDQTPTIKTHYGFWAEGVKLDALKQVDQQTKEIIYHEHVTNFLYTNPERFTIHFETIDQEIEQARNIRLTIDTEKDFEVARQIYAALISNSIPVDAKRIVSFVSSNHEWKASMENEISENEK